MPAAAVIPAPIVYIKVAAVKKLVVGFRGHSGQSSSLWRGWVWASYVWIVGNRFQSFTLKKLECSKQA